MNWLLFLDIAAGVFFAWVALGYLYGIWAAYRGARITVHTWSLIVFMVTAIYGVTRYFS